MTTVTESSGDGSYSSSILQDLKAMDLINRLEIADGLKQLLLSKDLTLKSLLNTSESDLAKILGIDEFIAKIVHSAIKDTAKEIPNA
ncbi:MAG: hypothetical protein WBZ36_28450 [Candidatus Nitrosopolaris sp.]